MRGGIKVKKVVRNGMVIGLCCILLYWFYSKYGLKMPVVKIGNYGCYVTFTENMKPTIDENELIIIKKCSEYELNDIVAYIDSYESLVTNRLVQIDEYSFIAKGDACLVTDENTDINKIEGKMIYHSKILGIFILRYLKFIIVIGIGVLIIISIKKRGKKENEKEKR